MPINSIPTARPVMSNPNQDDYGSATFMLAGADLSLSKSVDKVTRRMWVKM